MPLFSLLRISNAFLAVSAVLAGYCLFRFYAHTDGNLRVMPYLLGAGALLAVANAVWRNMFALAAAAREDDELPSGVASTATVFLIAVFTTLAGLMCAMTGGFGSFRAALIQVFLMLGGAALFRKTEIIAPIFSGLSVGMVFVIGMTAHPNFIEMLYLREARLPPVFFAAYMTVVAVLAQVRDSSRPRGVPEGEDLADNETASRLLTMRDDAIDSVVVWFGGAALIVIPAAAVRIMPFHWLSTVLFVFLAVSTLTKLIPVLVYRTRKDLDAFIESVTRGGCLLNGGIVASLGDYQMREIYEGVSLSLPAYDELAAVAIIVLLAAPAWLFARMYDRED